MLVCFSTISPECAAASTTACASVGVNFVCAPVSGRPDAAQRGELIVWLSAASSAAVERASSLLGDALLARHVEVLSSTDATAAARFKLCTNFLVYGGVQLIAEATGLAKKCGAGSEAIATFLDLMCPHTFLAGYSAKIRDSDFHGGDRGAPLTVGSKDLRLIWEMLLRVGKRDGLTEDDLEQAMPTLTAARRNMALAQSAARGVCEAAERTEWCAFAKEVEKQLGIEASRGSLQPSR